MRQEGVGKSISWIEAWHISKDFVTGTQKPLDKAHGAMRHVGYLEARSLSGPPLTPRIERSVVADPLRRKPSQLRTLRAARIPS